MFEGLGTPVGFDFYAQTQQKTYELGENPSLRETELSLQANLPKLHPMTPQLGGTPTIFLKLILVRADGSQRELTKTEDTSLTFKPDEAGAYRIEVSIIPRHYSNFISYKKELLNQEYPWIITNHIYVQP